MSAPAPAPDRSRARYWLLNIRILFALLGIWFLVSFVFGILLVDVLNQVHFPGSGIPLGFWFAQQGSILVFLALVWAYVGLMNRLDRTFGVRED